MAAEDLILRFRLGGVKQALKSAREIARKAKEAATSARQAGAASAGGGADPGEDPRVANRGRDRAFEKRGQAARARARAFGGPGLGGVNFGEADETLLQAFEGQGGFRAGGLGVRGLGQVAGFALGGAAGAVVAELAQTVVEEFVRPFLRERFAALERERLDPFLARLEALERQSFERQLKEDERLQRTIAAAEIDRAGVLGLGKHVRTPGPIGRLD